LEDILIRKRFNRDDLHAINQTPVNPAILYIVYHYVIAWILITPYIFWLLIIGNVKPRLIFGVGIGILQRSNPGESGSSSTGFQIVKVYLGETKSKFKSN
jgi:hypothetical protein